MGSLAALAAGAVTAPRLLAAGSARETRKAPELGAPYGFRAPGVAARATVAWEEGGFWLEVPGAPGYPTGERAAYGFKPLLRAWWESRDSDGNPLPLPCRSGDGWAGRSQGTSWTRSISNPDAMLVPLGATRCRVYGDGWAAEFGHAELRRVGFLLLYRFPSVVLRGTPIAPEPFRRSRAFYCDDWYYGFEAFGRYDAIVEGNVFVNCRG